jgi:DNA-binding HxlR family transcriptional regulator
MEDGTSRSPGHTEGTIGRCADVSDTSACELRDLLDRLSDKWSLLVVELLGGGPRRFNDLRRQIDGISQRMLTLSLRQLERDGLVHRTVYPTVPPKVEYSLTPSGVTLLGALVPLVEWTRVHREGIAEARAAYGRRPALNATTP